MKAKKILTSIAAIAFAMPAMAAPSHTGEFPSGGLMQADYTYTNAATSTNMDGVYENSVNANAEYEWNIIPIVAGTYLPGGQTSTTQCTAGNFCPGVATNNADRTPHYQTVQEGDQGLTSCSTTTNGVYTGSATGATASTDCFRSCANSDITHATGITGNVYYNGTNGDGVKDCTPTACENGWHVKAAVTAPDLITAIGITPDWANMSHLGHGSSIGSNGFSITFDGKGTITGKYQCSTQAGSTTGGRTTWDSLPDSSGGYCYCILDSWTPSGGSTQELSALWVFHSNQGSDDCPRYCQSNCLGEISETVGEDSLRAAMFRSVQSSPAMCEANTITITWTGASQTDIDANNAGTATYDGDIRTPRAAEQITGKTFKGWRFEKPTTPSNP